MKASPALPCEEWDFRKVGELELNNAILWEYSRESEGIRKKVSRWIGSKVQPNFTPANSDSEIILHELTYWKRLPFPKPWVTMGTKYSVNTKYSRIQISPAIRIIDRIDAAKKVAGVNADLSLYLYAILREKALLSIDWSGHSVKDIVRDFERWIYQESKKHPESRKPGRQSQAPFEKLKWLAAYRLKKAGFGFRRAQIFLAQKLNYKGNTFEEAQSHLQKQIATAGKTMLPIYVDKGAWSRAIKGAGNELALLEKAII